MTISTPLWMQSSSQIRLLKHEKRAFWIVIPLESLDSDDLWTHSFFGMNITSQCADPVRDRDGGYNACERTWFKSQTQSGSGSRSKMAFGTWFAPLRTGPRTPFQSVSLHPQQHKCHTELFPNFDNQCHTEIGLFNVKYLLIYTLYIHNSFEMERSPQIHSVFNKFLDTCLRMNLKQKIKMYLQYCTHYTAIPKTYTWLFEFMVLKACTIICKSLRPPSKQKKKRYLKPIYIGLRYLNFFFWKVVLNFCKWW